MNCPFCGSRLNKVVDKRSVTGLEEIRRRRECLKCQRRFTTYERLVKQGLIIIKNDGRKEEYTREKLRLGIMKSLEKRPLFDQVDFLTDKIEMKLRKKGYQEVSSKAIGRYVLLELKKLDRVAYLRFASVYRRFEQLEDFTKELSVLDIIYEKR